MTFDGKRVGRRWRRVLTAARRAGVPFTLTSGRRTLREQWRLFRQNMQRAGARWVQRPGRPLTAFPSPLAPHIRKGRCNHALDINSLDGGETRLQDWLEQQGAHPTNPVPGEAWHLELTARDLRRLDRRLRRREPRRVGHAGTLFVAAFEGFRSQPYRDAVGVWTIGYGHTRGVTANTRPWTRRHALAELRRELNALEYAGVVNELELPLSQRRFVALVSFVYNLGPGAIAASTGIGRALRARQWRRAGNQMLRWDKAGGRRLLGLTLRRRAERRLFLSHPTHRST